MLQALLRKILSLPLEELLLLVLALGWALLRLLNRLGTTALITRKLGEELSTLKGVGKQTEQDAVSKNGRSLTKKGKDDVPEST
jgi:hypothetical protein